LFMRAISVLELHRVADPRLRPLATDYGPWSIPPRTRQRLSK
jgi:hypothetical protein